MFAPTKAQASFKTAEKELEAAIAKYNDARVALQRESGDFTATDKNIMLNFSATTGQKADQYEPTDC